MNPKKEGTKLLVHKIAAATAAIVVYSSVAGFLGFITGCCVALVFLQTGAFPRSFMFIMYSGIFAIFGSWTHGTFGTVILLQILASVGAFILIELSDRNANTKARDRVQETYDRYLHEELYLAGLRDDPPPAQ